MNWIQTIAGRQMAETITRYLPRILVCLEHISRTLITDTVIKTKKEEEYDKQNSKMD